jgi:uncharacterized protein YjiS (DUF1127 family)
MKQDGQQGLREIQSKIKPGRSFPSSELPRAELSTRQRISASRRTTMIDDVNSTRPSSHEFERSARHERSLFIAAFLRAAARGIERSCHALVRCCLRMISEYLVWRGMRALEQLDDHMLADVGVPRGGIEHIVRNGRPARSPRTVGFYPRPKPRLLAQAGNPATKIAG